MADPFSVAAAAITLAGTGIKLVQTLRVYIDSVNKADKRLKPIIHHIELLSNVLAQIGTLLSDEQTERLCNQSLIDSVSSTTSVCKDAFSELEGFVTKALSDGRGSKIAALAK
jgi:hypothetical protein